MLFKLSLKIAVDDGKIYVNNWPGCVTCLQINPLSTSTRVCLDPVNKIFFTVNKKKDYYVVAIEANVEDHKPFKFVQLNVCDGEQKTLNFDGGKFLRLFAEQANND